MKSHLKRVGSRVWLPLKKWTGAILQRIRKNNGDDNQFNHPYIIF